MVAGLILLLSIGVIYFLIMPAYRQMGVQDNQIKQIKEQIDARNNYYTTVESKVKALEDAGWAEKKKSIEAVAYTLVIIYAQMAPQMPQKGNKTRSKISFTKDELIFTKY